MPKKTVKSKQIIFREIEQHWKFQLGEDHVERLELRPAEAITTAFIKLSKNGRLRIKKGYAWNGPTLPVEPESSHMRASLVHDVLYQLMRLGKLDHQTDRELADRIFLQMCREDGMAPARAAWVHKAVEDLGARYARPRQQRESKWHLAPELDLGD